MRCHHHHVWYIAHERGVRFENNASCSKITVTDIFPGLKWSVFLLRIVMHGAVTNVFCLNRELRVRAYVDDIKWYLRLSYDLLDRTKELHALLMQEFSSFKLELSVTRSGKEGNSKLEVSSPHAMERLEGFCWDGWSGMDSGIEYSSIDEKNTFKETGRQKS